MSSILEAQDAIYGVGRGPPLLPHGDDVDATASKYKRKRRPVRRSHGDDKDKNDNMQPSQTFTMKRPPLVVPIGSSNPLPASDLPAGFPPELAFRALAAYSLVRTLSLELRLSPFSPNAFLRALHLPMPCRLLGKVHVALLRLLLPGLHMHYHWGSADKQHHSQQVVKVVSKKRKVDGLKWQLRAGDNLEFLDYYTWPVYFDDYAHLTADILYAQWHADPTAALEHKALDVSMIPSDLLPEERLAQRKVLTKIGTKRPRKTAMAAAAAATATKQPPPPAPSVILLDATAESSDDEVVVMDDDDEYCGGDDDDDDDDDDWEDAYSKRSRKRPRRSSSSANKNNSNNNNSKAASKSKPIKQSTQTPKSASAATNKQYPSHSRPTATQGGSVVAWGMPPRAPRTHKFYHGKLQHATSAVDAYALSTLPPLLASGIVQPCTSPMTVLPATNGNLPPSSHPQYGPHWKGHHHCHHHHPVAGGMPTSVQENASSPYMQKLPRGTDHQSPHDVSKPPPHGPTRTPARRGTNGAPQNDRPQNGMPPSSMAHDVMSQHSMPMPNTAQTAKLPNATSMLPPNAMTAPPQRLVAVKTTVPSSPTPNGNSRVVMHPNTLQTPKTPSVSAMMPPVTMTVSASANNAQGQVMSKSKDNGVSSLLGAAGTLSNLHTRVTPVQPSTSDPQTSLATAASCGSSTLMSSASSGSGPGCAVPASIPTIGTNANAQPKNHGTGAGANSNSSTVNHGNDAAPPRNQDSTSILEAFMWGRSLDQTAKKCKTDKDTEYDDSPKTKSLTVNETWESESMWAHFRALKSMRAGVPYHRLSVEKKLDILEFLLDDVLCLDTVKDLMSKRQLCEQCFETPYGPLPKDTDLESIDNEDYCAVCVKDGDLLCCDGCNNSYHTRCIGLSKNAALPEGRWFCPECVLILDPAKAGPLFRGSKSSIEWFSTKDAERGLTVGMLSSNSAAAPEKRNHLQLEHLIVYGFAFSRSRSSPKPFDPVPPDAPVPYSSKELQLFLGNVDPSIVNNWPMAQVPVCPARSENPLSSRVRAYAHVAEVSDPFRYENRYKKAPMQNPFHKVTGAELANYEDRCSRAMTQSVSHYLNLHMRNDKEVAYALKDDKLFSPYQMIHKFMLSLETSLANAGLLDSLWETNSPCKRLDVWKSNVAKSRSIPRLCEYLVQLVDAVHPRAFKEDWHRCPGGAKAHNYAADTEGTRFFELAHDASAFQESQRRHWERCPHGSIRSLLRKEGIELHDWICKFCPDAGLVSSQRGKRKKNGLASEEERTALVSDVQQSSNDECPTEDQSELGNDDSLVGGALSTTILPDNELCAESVASRRRSDRTSVGGEVNAHMEASSSIAMRIEREQDKKLSEAIRNMDAPPLDDMWWPVAGRKLFEPIGCLPAKEVRRLGRNAGAVHAAFVQYSTLHEVGQVAFFHMWRKAVLHCYEYEQFLLHIRVLQASIDDLTISKCTTIVRRCKKAKKQPDLDVYVLHKDAENGECQYLILTQNKKEGKWVSWRDVALEPLAIQGYLRREARLKVLRAIEQKRLAESKRQAVLKLQEEQKRNAELIRQEELKRQENLKRLAEMQMNARHQRMAEEQKQRNVSATNAQILEREVKSIIGAHVEKMRSLIQEFGITDIPSARTQSLRLENAMRLTKVIAGMTDVQAMKLILEAETTAAKSIDVPARKPRRQYTCGRCGEPGHSARTCPQNQSQHTKVLGTSKAASTSTPKALDDGRLASYPSSTSTPKALDDGRLASYPSNMGWEGRPVNVSATPSATQVREAHAKYSGANVSSFLHASLHGQGMPAPAANSKESTDTVQALTHEQANVRHGTTPHNAWGKNGSALGTGQNESLAYLFKAAPLRSDTTEQGSFLSDLEPTPFGPNGSGPTANTFESTRFPPTATAQQIPAGRLCEPPPVSTSRPSTARSSLDGPSEVFASAQHMSAHQSAPPYPAYAMQYPMHVPANHQTAPASFDSTHPSANARAVLDQNKSVYRYAPKDSTTSIKSGSTASHVAPLQSTPYGSNQMGLHSQIPVYHSQSFPGQPNAPHHQLSVNHGAHQQWPSHGASRENKHSRSGPQKNRDPLLGYQPPQFQR